MNNDHDSNYISVGTWIMFITAIPIVGVLVILFGAFTGEKESRKNDFRAILAWCGVAICLLVLFILLGNGANIMKHIHALTYKT